MARAAALANRSAANRKAAGGKSGKAAGGGVNLGYTPPEFVGPPPGTFDPGLEAQVRSSERGLLDLIEQTHLEGKRGRQDTTQAQNLLRRKISQGRADLSRQRGYAQQDAGTADQQLHTSFARDLEDLATAKQRGEENYTRTLGELQHKYASAAQVQGETSLRQGTDEAGTNAASAAVRGANQAYDQQGIDLAHSRAEADLAQREGRVRQDFATNEQQLQQGLGRQMVGYDIQGNRLGQEGHTQFNALHLAALRAQQDRVTKLSHAKREQGIYSTDVAQQAFYQAHQLNPNIRFPIPAATTGLGGGAAGAGGGAVGSGAHPPAIGGGVAAPFAPHVHSPIAHGVGLGPAVSRPRRAYTRY